MTSTNTEASGGPTEASAPPQHPFTCSVDTGGTGIKASVLDATGRLVADRVRVKTPYPLSPERFVEQVVGLLRPLPAYDRVSVGFPGVVRAGHIRTAPHFVTVDGPGTAIRRDLLTAWTDFDAAGRLAEALGRPVRVANDADVQGLAVVAGQGIEFVVTLGTGVGTALFENGRLCPHLEFAHHPLRKGEEYNEQIGDAALGRIGMKKWRRRVLFALSTLERVVVFDRCFVGGGNARHLTGLLGENYTIVDNLAGILGGIKLWGDTAG